jgi:cytochrome c oxidase subunit 2
MLAVGLAAASIIAVAAAPDEKVILELNSLDRTHGFKVPDLGLDVAVLSDTTVRVRVVPEKAGRFVFLCDNFCGDGHEDMDGVIVVSE